MHGVKILLDVLTTVLLNAIKIVFGFKGLQFAYYISVDKKRSVRYTIIQQ